VATAGKNRCFYSQREQGRQEKQSFDFIKAKFVPESRSRGYFLVNLRKICRREPFSEPHFSSSKQNMSQRTVLEATFHFFSAEFVAESRSRSHFSFNRSKICRRKPLSEPLSSSSKQNMSQRAVLEATFQLVKAKYVAESCSRNHILLFYR
jgi:hypothetical protein